MKKQEQILVGRIIGIKCQEIARDLGSVLLRSRPSADESAQQLNETADMSCCALNALARAAEAKTIADFVENYDRAVLDAANAERASRPLPGGPNPLRAGAAVSKEEVL